jgi:hypothetical protein
MPVHDPLAPTSRKLVVKLSLLSLLSVVDTSAHAESTLVKKATLAHAKAFVFSI